MILLKRLSPILLPLCFLTANLFAAGSGETEPQAPAASPAVSPSASSVPVVPTGPEGASEGFSIDYAQGFRVEYREGYKLVEVTAPWPEARTSLRYILVPRGAEKPAGVEGVIIPVPLRSLVSLSTTYLPSLEALDLLPALTGVDRLDYIYSPRIRKRAEQGALEEFGSGGTLDLERLTAEAPDAVMLPGYGAGDPLHQETRRTAVPVIVNGDWVENHPLARAEWIKFIALFFNKEREAHRFFKERVKAYKALAAEAAGLELRPQVFCNTPWQGTWYMPGRDSYFSHLLQDAGADYPWSGAAKGPTLYLTFEEVFAAARNADLWLAVGSAGSRRELLTMDERFAEFRAYREDRVYNTIKRTSAAGANDYWESGALYPDRILRDLIIMLHYPEREAELYYYERLKPDR